MAQTSITGTAGRDKLYGTVGDDVINGLADKDHLHGLAGDDVLHGGFDDDMLWGGAGNDIYFVDTVEEKVFEHRDEGTIDTVISTISYALGHNVEWLFLAGGVAPLNATGNRLDNMLVGNFGVNVLAGGLGNDTLDGGGGHDVYLFDTKPGPGNVDLVSFIGGEDVIALDRRIFSGISGANAFQNGAGALDSEGRIIFDAATGTLTYDPDGTGPAAAVQLATLTGVAGPLSEADFLLV